MKDRVIKVRFMAIQNAEELYRSVECPSRVYVRQPCNRKDRVLWLTSTKWQGGYEADCTLRAGITMQVVDKNGLLLFEETVEEDPRSCDSSAQKNKPFSYEQYRSACQTYAEKHNLRSHNEWRSWLLDERQAVRASESDDNWLYFETTEIQRKIIALIVIMGVPYNFVATEMKHKLCNKTWTIVELQDANRDSMGICGYTF